MPKEVPVYGVNKACGSGLKAVALAAQSILLGDADVVVAGGMESMSGAPYIIEEGALRRAAWGTTQLLDSMIADGLTCPITLVHMGITAENIAAKYGISREEQDEFAAESQQKAGDAIKGGKFKAEIVPVEVPGAKKGETFKFDTDEHPRPDTTADVLGGAAARLQAGGRHRSRRATRRASTTAPRRWSSCRTRRRRSSRLTPLATIRAYASAGVDPVDHGHGPVAGVREGAREGRAPQGGDRPLGAERGVRRRSRSACCASSSIPKNRVNVNGGAIALGHPIGASGARVLTTLLYAMAGPRRAARRRVALHRRRAGHRDGGRARREASWPWRRVSSTSTAR